MGRQPPEIFEPVENNLNLKGRGFRRSLIGKVNAEEVVAIAEGRSKVWDKRAQLHREVTLLRANSNHPGLRKLKNVYGGI